jgi:ABC-type Na+ efflux pump permease subunit
VRLRGSLRKEATQAWRDPVGLGAALAAPPAIVWVFSQIRLGEVHVGPAFRETSPVALVLCLSLWLSGLATASTALHRERLAGTLERLRATPFSPEVMMGTKAAVLGALGLLQAGLAWAAAQLLLPKELAASSPAGLLLALALLSLAAVATGIFLAACLPSPAQVANGVTFLTLAAISLSGFFKPVAELGGLQPVASALPFTLAYQAVRSDVGGLPVAASTPAFLALEAGALLALGAVALRLAAGARPRG